MKTFTPEKEYHDIGTSQDSTIEETVCKHFKAVEVSHQAYLKDNDYHNSSESDNLILSPDLVSSFRTLQPIKHKSSPGHYLQKVFLSSVAQKFHSKSLPNCSDKRRNFNLSGNNSKEDIYETSTPLVKSAGNIDPKEGVAENWFKTWPEKSDKCSNISGNSQCENNTSVKCVHSDINKSTCFRINCDEGNFLCDECSRKQATENSLDSQTRSDGCVNKSHISLGLNKGLEVECAKGIGYNCPNSTIVKRNHNKSSPKTVPFDELLNSFPIAYSPVTKQLLLITSDNQNLDNNYPTHTSYNKSTKLPHFDKDILNLEEKDTVVEVPSVPKESAGSKGLECDLGLTALHLRQVNTEASSFSSNVSSLSDISPSVIEDSALGSLLDQGDSCSLVSVSGCSAFSDDSIDTDTKKKSLTGFLSRNIFNWKSGSKSQDSQGRWKLFGKNSSPLSSHSSLTADSYAEEEGGSFAPGLAPRLETRVASSSALIQLDRPANLPAKSEEEQARHRAQYQQILDAAKKKEVKEAKIRKKQLQLQLKAEEQLAQAIAIWTHEILPRWNDMHNTKKAQELWWQGVPPCVRGKVWKLAISNHLNLTHSLYNKYALRAQERLRGGGPSSEDDKEASMELIQLDISRTFPHLCIFQRGGPYYDMLHCLLAAYVCYRPQVGYVQGMSFIAAILILNMEAADAFVCFANLLDQPCHRAFYHLSQPHMQAYYSTYNQLFRENLPLLHSHFTRTTLTPDLYLLDWIYTVFTKTMNLDLACRVWDVFLRDGEQFLFRTALGVLHLCQDLLLQMDFVRGSQFLTRLPDDLPGDQLFKSISCIRMMTGNKTFQDILSLHSAELDNYETCLS